MRILVTGFDPFGKEKINPAFEAVKLLPDTVAGAEIIKLEIPTVFGKCEKLLSTWIKKEKPDAVLCVGQAGGRASITVERVGINLVDARIADNEGNQPIDRKIRRDGPDAYFSTLPTRAIVDAIQAQGIPASLSYSAGCYVCNYILYSLLYLIDKSCLQIKGGFIHVPYMTLQGIGKAPSTPTMSLDNMEKGLEAAIGAIVQEEQKAVSRTRRHSAGTHLHRQGSGR